ncbi:hypothetical protein DFQ26_009756 [Actinomortierella ambigua]|nr:hypothetical protein DFQ26_009756 [Actinomortierella ambigua]
MEKASERCRPYIKINMIAARKAQGTEAAPALPHVSSVPTMQVQRDGREGFRGIHRHAEGALRSVRDLVPQGFACCKHMVEASHTYVADLSRPEYLLPIAKHGRFVWNPWFGVELPPKVNPDSDRRQASPRDKKKSLGGIR